MSSRSSLCRDSIRSEICGEAYSAFLRAQSEDVSRTIGEAHLKAE